MSYARRYSTRSGESLPYRLGRATTHWAQGLWADVKLSLKLSLEAVGQALLKPRTVTILDTRLDADPRRTERVAAEVRVNSRRVRGSDRNLTPLP